MNIPPVEIFSTCPDSREIDPAYLQRVVDVARWSEEFGCRGILVYTDNGLLDAWQVAQVILENTKTLAPLIAVQPIYMHPYTVAKKVATYAHLFGRRVYLNLVAGGFKNDLIALGDETPHDDRYLRMIEYTLIIRGLLEGPGPVTFEGKYYSVKNLKLTPSMPPELFPGLTSSGSSEVGWEAARTIGSVAVKYPLPPGESEPHFEVPASGIGVRVGIITRESANQAWEVAEERFPEDREGQLKHQMAIKVSDSVWHKQLAAEEKESAGMRSPYWLRPFQNYKTFCPYLVGDYDQVAGLLAEYMAQGYRTFILDIPPSLEELEHTGTVFERAQRLA